MNGFGHAVLKTIDDGSLIIGSKYVPDTTVKFTFLIRLSPQGDTLWSRAYGIPGRYFQGVSGITVPSGEFIVLGTAYDSYAASINGGDATVTKFDANGNLLWHKEIAGLAGFSMYNPHCFCTKDGGFVLGANKVLGPGQLAPCLVRINQSGDITWSKLLENGNAGDINLINKVVHLSDMGFAFVGLTSVAPTAGSRIMFGKTDADGNLLWSKRLALTQAMIDAGYFTAGTDIIEKQDGGFVVLGFSIDSTINELALLDLSANGDLLSARAISPKQTQLGLSTNGWKFTLAGVIGNSPSDILDAILNMNFFDHALYRSSLGGYLIQSSLGRRNPVGIGSTSTIDARQTAFINLDGTLQPSWMRMFESYSVLSLFGEGQEVYSYVGSAIAKTQNGNYLITGGISTTNAQAYRNCLNNSGSDCSQYVNQPGSMFLLRTDADLQNSCLNPLNLEYTTRIITGWSTEAHSLNAQATTVGATTANLNTQGLVIETKTNCIPVADDQDLSGPLRIRDMPTVANPTRLIGSNEQGVLGSVVGENDGDMLVWEDGLWKTQPAPTGGGSGTGGDIWQDNGDNVTLPPTKNVGVGVAQPQAKLQVNGNLIAGQNVTITGTNNSVIGSGISLTSSASLVLAAGNRQETPATLNVSEGSIAMLTGKENSSIFTIKPAPCAGSTPGPVGEGYYGNCPTPTNPGTPSSPSVGVGVVDPYCRFEINMNGTHGLLCLTRGIDIHQPTERLSWGYIDNNYLDELGSIATSHIPALNYIGSKPALVINPLSNKETIYPGKIGVGNYYRNQLGLMGMDNTYSAPNAQLHIRINQANFSDPSQLTDAELTALRISTVAGSQEQDAFVIYESGITGIGTSYIPAGFKLAVNGKILCEEVRVKLRGNWPDYVFEPTFTLMPLEDLEKYIQENHHLPGMKSAAELEESGLDVMEILKAQQQKIEELTLYIIELEKKIVQSKNQMK